MLPVRQPLAAMEQALQEGQPPARKPNKTETTNVKATELRARAPRAGLLRTMQTCGPQHATAPASRGAMSMAMRLRMTTHMRTQRWRGAL